MPCLFPARWPVLFNTVFLLSILPPLFFFWVVKGWLNVTLFLPFTFLFLLKDKT